MVQYSFIIHLVWSRYLANLVLASFLQEKEIDRLKSYYIHMLIKSNQQKRLLFI
jgi:hypothetical protein